MDFAITDTLRGKKLPFEPLEPGKVKMYVCGPTIYDLSHVGHGRVYVFFDLVRRVLEYRGHRVKHVMNFTDIDDKLINRARELGITMPELAEAMALEFYKDFISMGILWPHVIPRATGHIPEIIEFVKGLIERGYAYESGGDVYFSVRKFPDYGKLSKQKIEELRAGARVEPGENKRDPLDFALWKAAKPGEPSWPSPWGPGRPGWHIECSAMILKHLGPQIDIHGGGADLIFPHHEDEIAQSEAYTGKKPFVRYWMHVGLLRIKGEKMSKSLKNIVPIREVLERYPAPVLRYFYYTAHYRSPMDFSWELLDSAHRTLRGLWRALLADASGSSQESKEEFQKFLDALSDDFDTPRALVHLNRLGELAEEGKGGRELGAALDILGIPREPPTGRREKELIELVLKIREELREEKRYDLADRIRSALEEMGIEVQDTPQGPKYLP